MLPCSHCGAHGTLIGHGLLRGYEERGSELAIRGRRLFCSNRGRKRGCGRTTSVLLAAFIERFSVTVAAIFRLFLGRCRGDSVAGAAGATWPLSVRSAYRLAARLERSSLDWRALLSARLPAPSSAHPFDSTQFISNPPNGNCFGRRTLWSAPLSVCPRSFAPAGDGCPPLSRLLRLRLRRADGGTGCHGRTMRLAGEGRREVLIGRRCCRARCVAPLGD